MVGFSFLGGREMKKLVFVSTLLMLAVITTGSHGAEYWAKTYGGAAEDHANTIQQTSDGGFIVTWSTRSFGAGNWDIWVLKLDRTGSVSWQKTYGGEGQDEAYAIQQTSDGGYIVGGVTFSFNDNADAWILKLDSNGNVIWQKTYEGGGGGNNHDDILAMQQTTDGGLHCHRENHCYRLGYLGVEA